MKTLIIVSAFVLIGAVSAQGEGKGPSMTDVLVRRGMMLEDVAKRTVHELKEQGREHLVSALEHEIVLIEALILDLQKNAVLTEPHKHRIEEELLHAENRVAEEIINIQAAIHHQHQGHSVAELIKQAEALITKAQGVLRHVPASDKDYNAAQHEVRAVGELIKALRAHPDAKDTKKEEEQLVRHELTLEQLLKRLSKHVKPDPGSHHPGTVSPHGH